jgi:hypothetical protein
MKIQLNFLSFLPRRKNVVFAFVFISTFLFNVVIPQSAQAVSIDGLGWCYGDNGCEDNSSYASKAVGAVSDSVLKPVAIGLLDLEAAIANAAAVIFVWILDPNSFALLMNNEAFYQIWKIVRDTMNMLFILVLLFSAFATIYQIDKYKWNKILWMVIIMALLVNFSWPIARAIVDFFNSMMYFFVQSIFQTDGTKAAQDVLSSTDLKAIFLPPGAADKWPNILLAIVVMFIFAMTLLMLSLMMLIRLVALPILVMFSPIGFAGMAAPLTQSYAKKWWDKLFQYASYGPFAVFMVLVSIRVLQNAQGLKQSIATTAVPMTAPTGDINSDMLSALVYYAIPIVLFWMAITSAQSMSSQLSAGTTKLGISFGKWAGRQPWRGVKGFSRATGATGAAQQAWKNRKGLFGSDARLAREAREDRWARRLNGGGAVGAENAAIDAANKREAAIQERLNRLGNASTASALLANGDADEKKAAALYLAEKDAFRDAGEFNKALDAVGKDFSAAKTIIGKAPKDLLTNATQFTAALASLNANGHQKLLGDLVSKGEKKGLGASGADYDKITEQLRVYKKKADGTFEKDNADNNIEDTGATEALKKAYDKRIVEEGQAHIRVDSEISKIGALGSVKPLERQRLTQKAYADVFNKMSANDMTKQNEATLMNGQFIRYMKSKTEQSQKEAFAAMARENKENIVEKWKTQGVKFRR